MQHGKPRAWSSATTNRKPVTDGPGALHLVKMWLDTPVEEQDGRGRKKRTTVNRDTKQGIPQGSPLTPLTQKVILNSRG